MSGRRGFRGVKTFRQKINGVALEILPEVTELVRKSIVDGSVFTGAPGQVVGEGDLKASWRVEQMTPTRTRVVSDSPYARQNEDGVMQGGKSYVQRSTTGGRHSVRMTRRNAKRLMVVAAEDVMQRHGGSAA